MGDIPSGKDTLPVAIHEDSTGNEVTVVDNGDSTYSLKTQAVIRGATSGNLAEVTETNRLKTDVLLEVLSTLSTQIYGWDKGESIWKKILIKPYPTPTSTQGWLSIWGEVGSTTRAKNPLHWSTDKVSGGSLTIGLIDVNVTSGQVWYVPYMVLATEGKTFYYAYQGITRNYVKNFVGDGSTKYFNLDDMAVNDNQEIYTSLKVGGVTKVNPENFEIEDVPNSNGIQSRIYIKSAPGNGVAIEVTYHRVIRKLAMYLPAAANQTVNFAAPIRLTDIQFFLLIGDFLGSAGQKMMATVNGFYINANEDIF